MRQRKPKRKARLARSPLKQGRKPLKRTTLKRSTALKAKKGLTRGGAPKPKRRPAPLIDDRQIRRAWHDDVIAAAPRVAGRRICPVCREPSSRKNPLEAHHVLAQASIKRYVRSLGLAPLAAAERLSALLWDLGNGLPCCRRCHDLHTRAQCRIPAALLTVAHRAFAAKLGAEHLLDRYYSSPGPGR